MDKIGAGAVPVVWTTLENQKQIDPMYAVCCGAAISKGGRIMDSKLYEQKRNELIHLLDQVIAIDEIPSQTRENIESIREKCVTNQFEVVLIGEFQGGKSTTFNAICDGREISPRGVNIKTSACRISAQNLADPKAEEYAEIAWRSDQELLLGMINILEPHLKKVQPDRFLKATPDAMVYGGSGMKGQLETLASAGAEKEEIRPLSLRDPEDRNLIGQALDDEWTALKRNKKGYDSDQTGQLDVLRIASIIHLYLEDPFVRQLTEKGRFNIQELSKLVTFPWDWEKRWMNHSATAFSAEEIAFAFIAGVRCHIHSPNLARLGCVITDCPGLFASRWDTLLARQAMLSADAILYLFGGEKAISQGDIHALNEIRLSQQDHKLFYAINVKGNLSNIKNRIRIENASTLTNRGFDLSPEAIHLYNALLGLCARNGHAALSNRLDNLSREQFIKTGRQIDERFSSEFEIHWKQTASMAIRRMDDFSEGVNCLDEVGLQQVVEFSGLDDLVSAIEETVIAKKAQSVLVHQGGAKAKSALMAIEGNLKSQEKAARKTEDEFHLAVLRARDDLELFQKKVTEIIDELSESNLGYPLACEFEDQVIKAHIPEMSEAITDGFADSLWTLKSFLAGLLPNSQIKIRKN
ncbi:dynamin family protein [Desulfosarcina cetonica]|uniref:dynamin family protein n=1 Tax=Desulfosarcina cetonica TaxID=90730 RepID=UPI0009FB04CD|nr:dynamin family protein [Desulfosarcina cetonica]